MTELEREALQEFENVAQAHRHQLSNARSAARLLIGAYGAGDIDRQAYRAAMAALCEIDSLPVAIDRHLESLEACRPPRSLVVKGPSLRRALESRRCMVVDDDLDRVGWRVVFTAMLGESTVFAADPAAALAELDVCAGEVSLVLLDLAMPRIEDGLGALREIKARHVDLPVVVFSGVDETPVAKKCFAYGAEDFFVKELEAPDRASLPYYIKLRDTIIAALPDDTSRELWRRIVSLEATAPRAEAGARLHQATVANMKRAYFFLCADESDPRARLLFGDLPAASANVFSHALMEAATAVEVLVDHRYREGESPRRKSARASLAPAPVKRSDFRTKVSFLCQSGALGSSAGEVIDRLWRVRSQVAHGKRRLDRKRALSSVLQAMDIVEAMLAPRGPGRE